MDLAVKPTTIKFLCSYGGRILPRYPDGKLRYHGGETRVLSVERSISFAELLMKLGEMSGTSVVNLRCQLPKEDLDALVSITSDEDLANLIEEYDRVAPPAPPAPSLKIRAFLSAPKTTKKVSPPPSTTSPKSSFSAAAAVMLPPRYPKPAGGGGGLCFRHVRRPPVYVYPQPAGELAGETPQYAYRHTNSCYVRLIQSANHLQ
ncbi:Octicosapeptide Phox Bem1p family isoform 1 [Olea europaea subsp. europaea]|uniref:Octicosapeptide Phox Bem1p family isoform 1 n=1 Tax=Olea europaea subsp. europaea TaxID=158383 RepID=A0A8S0PE09_OLEEU|nr:Octicosapeptide Phox Bem1p family isoform 1 [Olea europaea subsp. europaea]